VRELVYKRGFACIKKQVSRFSHSFFFKWRMASPPPQRLRMT
jgi:hypothetical protein